jgi:hypothetical protein
MSYTVSITVTNCQTNRPIKGATCFDGTTTATTNSSGMCNFEVQSSDDDPDLPDNVQISASGYGPQSITLNPENPEVSVCLEPYPVPPPPGQPTKPVVTLESNEPATLTGPGTITVSWVSAQYDKFLIWWTVNGEAGEQGEVDKTETSGSWTTGEPVIPGAIYTFKVEGGTYEVWGYNYSGWGNTITVQAVQNLRSLVQFLEHSGINPVGLHVSSIMGGQTSLRQVMKLA